MPNRSASPWKLTSRRRWLRSRFRLMGGRLCSVTILVILLIGRSARAGGVVLQRNEVFLPRGQHRSDDAPRLLRFVTADRQGWVAVEHVQQQPAVGGQLGGLELGLEGQRNQRM